MYEDTNYMFYHIFDELEIKVKIEDKKSSPKDYGMKLLNTRKKK